MSQGKSKAQVRASKAGKYYRSKSEEEEDEDVQNDTAPTWLQVRRPQSTSYLHGMWICLSYCIEHIAGVIQGM